MNLKIVLYGERERENYKFTYSQKNINNILIYRTLLINCKYVIH